MSGGRELWWILRRGGPLVITAILLAGCGTERGRVDDLGQPAQARTFAAPEILLPAMPASEPATPTFVAALAPPAASVGAPSAEARALALVPPATVAPVLPADPGTGTSDDVPSGGGGGGGGSGGGTPGNSATPIGYLDLPTVGLSTFIVENGWNVKQLNRGGAGIGDGDLWSNGNIVLFGHRTSHGGPFRHVNEVNLDDELTITRDDGTVRRYRVVDKFLDMPDAAHWADASNTVDGQPTLTLITCAHADGSPGGTARRWFIRAVAV